MNQTKNISGYFGITIGGIALMLSLVHFWAGPFAPQPTLETSIAEKAVAIKDATIKALKGEEYKKEQIPNKKWDLDRIIYVLTAVLGGLAVILAVVSFAKHEKRAVAGGAAALGISAIAFQFIAMFAMVLLFVLLLSSVISSLGFE
ncbi:MAG: hypothetical protein MK188_12080 [Gammaproteobacteria bacterium]|nr:hypothetical protein [Gammaproteobacteria bacterium]